METKVQAVQKRLADQTPKDIVITSKDRFVSLYQTIHGRSNGDLFYEAEKFHFLKQISENPSLAQCDKLSIMGAFLDIAVNGLSADPNMKQVYLVPYKGKCTVSVSPYGELFLRQRSKQILHADNPVLVYEGDHFVTGIRNGETFIEHTAAYPRKSDHIIACYVRLVRPDGSVDFKVLSENEFENIRKMSKSPNSPAYTTGRAGMFMAKTLKHAFKSYPRVKLRGDFSKVEEEIEIEEAIDYGFGSDETSAGTIESSSNGRITPNPASATAAPSASAQAVISSMTAAHDHQGHKVEIVDSEDPFAK